LISLPILTALALAINSPYSCNPNDIMEAEVASRMRFFFPDVHARGYYPGYDIIFDTCFIIMFYDS
jgi:beta-glucosidase/6-phospho-beta-glucosidase/beta-galactosidase